MFKLLLTLIPTVWFILIILWGFLIGLKRGFRKSTILLIHAVVAFAIALTFYLIMVNLDAADEMIVNVTNNFMGEGGLQRTLEVGTDNHTLSDILTEYIIKHVNYGEGMTLALEENAHYLSTLVSFAYHVVFFFVALLLYDILLFIFFIVYLIFYSESKHKAKLEMKEREEGSTIMYKKRHLLGSLVGTARAFVKAIFVMSFLGATLFLIGGGLGNYEYKKEYEFNDPNRKRIYDVYEALGSYGNTGIFKILNVIKDENEVPYYYFIANTVLSGKYVNPDLNQNRNVYFVRELGEYTRFIRETFDLLMKYDEDTMIKVINGEIEPNDDKVFAILGKEEFQKEFTGLIDKVESGTYVLDFSLSMVDSIAAHFDKTDMSKNMDEKTNELIKVMLVSDYYSPYVPDDANKKASGKKVETLKVSNLLERNDVKLLAASLLSILAQPKEMSTNDRIFSYNKYLVPALRQLSILNDPERKREVNGALERIFVAIENMYDRSDRPGDDELLTVEHIELLADGEDIDWAGEIGNLLDSLHSLGNLAETSHDPNDGNILNAIFKVFDKDGANYSANMTEYDNLTLSLEKSKILDKILNIDPIYDGMMSGLTSLYSEIYVPENISFANDGDSYGEIHWFLKGLKSVMTSGNNAKLIASLMNKEQSESVDMMSLIKEFCTNIAAEGMGEGSIIDNACSSKIMQMLLSSVIFANQDISSDFSIYIPLSALTYVGGEFKNLIIKEELKEALFVIPSFMDEMIKFTDSSDTEHYKNYNYIVETISRPDSLIFESDIIEATLSSVLIDQFRGSDIVVIPSTLSTPEEWLASNDGVGELRTIVEAIKAIGVDVNNLTSDSFANKIAVLNEQASGRTETKLEMLCNSQILHATFSSTLDKYVTDSGDNPMVDSNSKSVSKDSSGYYKKEELSALVDVINELNLDVKNMSLNNVTDTITSLNGTSSVDSSKSKLDVLYSSNLVQSMLYIRLNNIISSNSMLVDHPNAKEKANGNYDIYKKTEVKELITFISGIGATKLDNIDMDSITLSDNAIDSVALSEILKASISKELIDKDALVILDSDYDDTNDYIVGTALKELLLSVKNGLNITSIGTDFDTDSIKLPSADKVDDLLESSIMQSTISAKISAGSDDAYVARSAASIVKDFKNNNTILVSKTELTNFIEGIGTLSKDNSYEVEINNENLKALSTDDINKALSSSILHNIISSYMIDKLGMLILPTDIETIDVYNINTLAETNNDIVKKEKINELILLLP